VVASQVRSMRVAASGPDLVDQIARSSWSSDCSREGLCWARERRKDRIERIPFLSSERTRRPRLGEVGGANPILESESHGAEETVVVTELSNLVAGDACDQVVECGTDHAGQQVLGISSVSRPE
jgi:hypothetical protein